MRKTTTKSSPEHAPILRTISFFLSGAAALVAVVFTCWQVYITRRNAEAQVWQGFTQHENDITRMFVEHPILRPYFYAGKPITTSDPNFNAVMAVSEMYLVFFDSIQDEYVFSLPGMGSNDNDRLLWEQYFKDRFAESPALREFAKEKHHWFSTDFTPYIRTKHREFRFTDARNLKKL